MRIGSLFSGIGGLELGLEWAGVGRTVWQVERDPFCRTVLAKHWPDVERFDDVRTVDAHNLPRVDVICGGSPCQDISSAGKKAGIRGPQSILWREFARIVGEIRPSFVVLENSAAIVGRGLDLVLRDLAVLGFDAEWSTVSACAVGAPHMRRRLYLVAHANGHGEPTRAVDAQVGGVRADAGPSGWHWRDDFAGSVRVADGLPARLVGRRLHALGNAAIPQVAEVAGRRLLEIAASMERAA